MHIANQLLHEATKLFKGNAIFIGVFHRGHHLLHIRAAQVLPLPSEALHQALGCNEAAFLEVVESKK